MLSSFVITLREGLEAALIIAILAAYLKKTDRQGDIAKLWIGVGVAAGASLLLGLIVAIGTASLSRRSQELAEGITGLVAVGILTWMVFWMRHHAQHMKGSLHARLDETGATFALVLLAFTAVGREGLETVLFLYASFSSADSVARSATAAVAGLVAAAALGWGIYRGGIRLNLRSFFQVTGGLLVVVAAGILASSIHELNEAGLLLVLGQQAWDTSSIANPSAGGISGLIGSLLKGLIGYEARPTVLQVVAYWGYLIPALSGFYLIPALRDRRKVPSQPGAAETSRLSRAAT